MNPQLYPIICANIIIMCRATGADPRDVLAALQGIIWHAFIDRDEILSLIVESQVELAFEEDPAALAELMGGQKDDEQKDMFEEEVHL